MQFGMVGLGRMGAGMVRRLMSRGHAAVVYDRATAAVDALVKDGAVGAHTPAELAARLDSPRTVFFMVPAAFVDAAIDDLLPHLRDGDVLVDGGNSNYQDDIARAKRLGEQGLHYLDMGTSGGVWGEAQGYCLMIGGSEDVVRRLDPLFKALAPGRGDLPRTPGREKTRSTAEDGYLHCGPTGAGHFVKMVHNGIEYGVMAAYAEGLNILANANVGKATGKQDAETTPLRHPEYYRYDFDLADVTEVWRRGSVIRSWLLDLAAGVLLEDPRLEAFSGRVSDSGEGRWTLAAANDIGVPAHILASALFSRFSSRERDLFEDKVLSALRKAFGGHRDAG